MIVAVALAIVAIDTSGVASAQSRRSGPDALARALVLFEESETLYNEGQFSEAAALLRRAYALHPDPTLLFNLGRALEAVPDFDGAVDAYERYVRDAPDAADRPAIERRLETLRAHRDRLRPDSGSTEPPPARAIETAPPAITTASRSHGVDPAPWILLGSGVALVGAAIGLGVVSESDESAARAEPVQVIAVDLHARAEALAIAADVLFVVGGLAAAGGLVWGIVDVTSGDDAGAVQVEAALLPGSLTIRGRF